MRATRAQLADRLAHSQGVCEAMIADCQAGRGFRSTEDLGAALQAAAGAAAEALEAAVGDGEEAASPQASSPAPTPFGSPAAVTPNPLFEAQPDEGWEGEDELAAALAPVEEGQPCVLGSSARHNTSQQATPSPSGSGCATPDAAACSMRAAWQAAHTRVSGVRAQCNSWDLAGFVRQLGFEVRHGAGPQKAAREQASIASCLVGSQGYVRSRDFCSHGNCASGSLSVSAHGHSPARTCASRWTGRARMRAAALPWTEQSLRHCALVLRRRWPRRLPLQPPRQSVRWLGRRCR